MAKKPVRGIAAYGIDPSHDPADYGLEDRHELIVPQRDAVYAQLVALDEIMDKTAREQDVTSIHAPRTKRFKRPLAFKRPWERSERDSEIARRLAQPEFNKLRDAFGALHTEVRCGEIDKRKHVKVARAELANVIKLARAYDKVLAAGAVVK